MKTSRASHFDKYRTQSHKQKIAQAVKGLKRRGFTALAFADVNTLNSHLLDTIPPSATIGIPGSVTIRELGIIEKLQSRGNKIYQHWIKGLTEETDRAARMAEADTDCYLSSANAITCDGDIINIDGVGNRIAGMIYGPKYVIIVAGRNKLVSSIETGIQRSKETAAVMNAKRVGASTPCRRSGICIDCNASRRICRIISIIQYRPFQTKFSVLLVNKDLGF